MVMRIFRTCGAVLGVSLALAATSCTDSTKPSRVTGAPESSSASIPSASAAPDYADTGTGADPKVTLPTGQKVLVPPVRGFQKATLPEFTPETDGYTLYVSCIGGGKLLIVTDGKAGKRGPHPWDCNGVPIVIHVFTYKRAQNVEVETQGEARWEMAVVDGAQAG